MHDLNRPPILIVGAGPTGLTLAIWLRKLLPDQPLRIVSKASTTGVACRALVIQARTLEFYSQLSKQLVDEVIERGSIVDTVRLYTDGARKASLNFSKTGVKLTPYPFILSLSQDVHERILLRFLESQGVEVEWNTEVSNVMANRDEVLVTLNDKVESFSYVAACDGGHSTVREALDIAMEGGTYEHRFYVADVQLSQGDSTSGIAICLAKEKNYIGGVVAVHVPINSQGRTRLVGNISSTTEKPTFEDVRSSVIASIGVDVTKVNWFSAYHVHHRVASSFRHSPSGRVFILGDAGHLHTPVGGQGMNAGIGDSINLAWKLASVVSSNKIPDTLLDTFEEERGAFAKQLVNTTDSLFTTIMSPGIKGWLIRCIIVPFLIPILWRFTFFQLIYFQRIVSQLLITYQQSVLSVKSDIVTSKDKIQPGDRLPFIRFSNPTSNLAPSLDHYNKSPLLQNQKQPYSDIGSNFSPLSSLSWQFHLYGPHPQDMEKQADSHHGIPIHRFPSSHAAVEMGLKSGRIYLVRPDGHIGLICGSFDDVVLESYLTRWGLGDE